MALVIQFSHQMPELVAQFGWTDRVEQVPNVGICGNLLHLKYRFGVALALALLQMPLACQKGRTLHKKDGNGGQGGIIDPILAVLPRSNVGQRLFSQPVHKCVNCQTWFHAPSIVWRTSYFELLLARGAIE